ncbi:hypothetical protein, partial [Kribbella qitaiheensis]|uniref:hypothetical protein n=1 Tax=Kribbella qitaiheensis TaxID=1544730 RepID=UPI0036D2EF31
PPLCAYATPVTGPAVHHSAGRHCAVSGQFKTDVDQVAIRGMAYGSDKVEGAVTTRLDRVQQEH